MVIEWSKNYTLGIDLIDQQHKHFIELVNMVTDVIEKKEVESKLLFLISYLVGYAETHLVTEEKMFDEYKYNQAEEHKVSHDAFRKKVQEFMTQYQQSQDKAPLAGEIAKFMGDWLLTHILSTDKLYVDFFKERGF